MATIKNYGAALGGMAKEAITGTAKGLVGGLKGAMIREAPGLAGAYAFGKDLNKRANSQSSSPRMSGGNAPPPTSSQTSSGVSSPLGGLSQAVSLVAGQNKSNVINLEQVRQLRQLNASVINQSKLISFQVQDIRQKNQFAEEVANEQAIRDNQLLDAINKLSDKLDSAALGNNTGADGGNKSGLGKVVAEVATSAAGGFLKDGIKWLGGAIVAAIGTGWLFFRKQLAALALSAALRFGGGAALGGIAAVASPAIATGALAAAIVAGLAALLWPRTAGAATGKNADTVSGRDAAMDPEGAKRREAAKDATTKRVATRDQAAKQGREQEWDQRFGKTHDPVTGLLKDPKATTVYNPPAAGKVTSNFGEKRKDATGKEYSHQGIDIAMPVGSDVHPIAPGKVTLVTTSGAAGTYVQVTHPDGKVSEYMHLSQALAKVGDEVTLASTIGKSGGAKGDKGAGSSTGPHLHLQLKTSSGEPIDPSGLPGLGGLVNGSKVSPADNIPKVAGKIQGKLPGTKAEIDNSSVTGFYKNAVNFKDLPALGSLVPKADGESGSGTTISSKNAPIKVQDDKLIQVTTAVAKATGVNPTNGTLVPSQQAKQTALQSKLLKPLYTSNTDIIKKTNQTFLQQFKNTATRAFTQALTASFFPKGVGVSFDQAKRDDNYRGQQLQKIFGTQAASQKFATGLLGKTYGPMFAPVFNQLAQGYLEVGSRVAAKAIFQGIGGVGAEEAQGIMGQVLGNYAAGNKKLALEQLIFGASGGKAGGTALGMETLFAKYGFNNPLQGISYFASGLADMATAPFGALMGANTGNGVKFDPRIGKYVNADGSIATDAEKAAAAREYGASQNQGQFFSPGGNNYGGSSQAGYNPYATTQMQGGVVAPNSMLYGGPQPGQFRVVAPTVNAAGVTTAPTMAQAFGLTDQAQAGLSQKQLEVQQAQLELARISAEKTARAQAETLKADAEARAAGKSEAEAQAIRDQAQIQGNALVTDASAKYIVSGLTGQTGSGSATPGLKPGDAGYREGALFQRDPTTGKLTFGQELGNFGFDIGKMALGNKISQSLGITNPYTQMFANFAIQKGLNWGWEALKNSTIGKAAGDWLSSAGSTIADTAGSWLSEAGSSIASFFGFADGGIVTKATPGVFGEAGAEAVIPLANPTATKALSAAMGTDKQLSALGDQTELLTSIDGSLRAISGRGTASGTVLSGASSGSGSMFSGGLAGLWSPTGSSSTAVGNKPGVNAGKPGAMDIVTSIAGSIAKGYLVKQAAITAAELIAPGIGFETFMAYQAAGGGVAGAIAGVETGATMLGTGIAEGVSSAVAATGFAEAGSALLAGEGLGAALAAVGPVGWAVLGVAAVLSFFGFGGGGGSRPPPKEPKFHAAIYVTGNNDIGAIAPVYETVDYHAVPDVYKTIAYGLLRVAFNASKAAEQVTKVTPPFDYLYIKVEFNRIALCWGKGAPNVQTLSTTDNNVVATWGAPNKDLNLNTIAKDMIDLITAEFKKVVGADSKKLDTAAKGLASYNLDDLSSGLIQDLKTGQFKLDTKVGKGIFANDVTESNRISSLINNASSHKPTTGEDGAPLIWSMKDNAYVENLNPGALLYDSQGRPVYDIPGTSSGITSADFGGTDIVGIDRPANLYSPTTGTVTSTSGTGNTVISAPSSTKIDNSSVANFYNPPASAIDGIRNTVPG